MKKYKYSIGMLAFALLSALCGLYLGVSCEYKWFGNFGALIVLFGVASEYSLMQLELKALYASLTGQGKPMDGGQGIPDLRPKGLHRKLVLVSHTMVVSGTLVWGFGEWFLGWVLA